MSELLLGAPRTGRDRTAKDPDLGKAFPGGEIYLSMPGLGDRLAARVAGEIGEHPEPSTNGPSAACPARPGPGSSTTPRPRPATATTPRCASSATAGSKFSGTAWTKAPATTRPSTQPTGPGRGPSSPPRDPWRVTISAATATPAASRSRVPSPALAASSNTARPPAGNAPTAAAAAAHPAPPALNAAAATPG